MAEFVWLEDGAITSVPGFRAAGVAAGIKRGGERDLALVVSDKPCVAAGVFTTNRVKAAPVLYDRDVLLRNPMGVRGVVANSGCANACTGERGLRDAKDTAAAAAQLLGGVAGDYLVMSTGGIGDSLPMDKLLSGAKTAVESLASSESAGHDAARAIMTTDTVPKEAALAVQDGDDLYRIAGMAKGAGMIHPNMATLLCCLTSNVCLAPELAWRALRHAVEASLNLVTIDGDTSTNDTAVLLTNEGARMEPIVSSDDTRYGVFERALTAVMLKLAKGIVRDGEGATKFVSITVREAASQQEAKQVAMAIATSSLVKTAIYGEDANWGRIVCAAGYSGAEIDPDKLGVWLGDLELVRDGVPYDVDEARAAELLAQDEIAISVDLAQGEHQITVWTSDLTHEYVDINAHYRT